MKPYLYYFYFMFVPAVASSAPADAGPGGLPTKLKLQTPWTVASAKLLTSGAPGVLTTNAMAQASQVKRAIYVSAEATSAALPKEYSVLAIHDAQTGRTSIIDAEHDFYLWENSEMTGYTLGPGTLVWSTNYSQVSDSEGGVDAAIQQFEAQFDVGRMNDAWMHRLRDRINLREATPQFFFSDMPAPGGAFVRMQFNAVTLSEGVLRLDLQNPSTHNTASIWIDLKAQKVIRSVAGGREMDLTTGRPYATPKGGN